MKEDISFEIHVTALVAFNGDTERFPEREFRAWIKAHPDYVRVTLPRGPRGEDLREKVVDHRTARILQELGFPLEAQEIVDDLQQTEEVFVSAPT